MPNSDDLIAFDCFAGAGGLSRGLLDSGFQVKAAFDMSPTAVATYRQNIGSHIVEGLAQDINGRTLLKIAGIQAGKCDLIAGGPPCQGFSRQRRGSDQDVRNDLILDFLRIVTDIMPVLFLMENVSAIGGARGHVYFREFLKQANLAGYSTQFRVLDAADFGVPQHRRRMFVVGERDDGRSYFRFPPPTNDKASYKTVRDAIGDLPSPMTNLDRAAMFHNHDLDNISDLNRRRISHVPPGGGRADIPEDLRLPCHKVSVDVAGHRGVYGRLWWDAPAGTITTKCNSFTRGRFAHPAENRNITMREAARLQGFADRFRFTGGRVDVAHQIGNAVPPPLAAAIGRSLRMAIIRRRKGGPVPADPPQLLLAF